MEIFFFLIFFAALCGVWANNQGRNGLGWGVAALLISPLIVALILLVKGKTLEKKAEEQKKIRELMEN